MSKKETPNINSDGGPVFLGNVNNKGEIRGRSDHHTSGMNADEASRLFNLLFTQIDRHSQLSTSDKADLKMDVQEVRQELAKQEQADESFVLRRLRNIARIAPDIFEVTLATITNPIVGFGIVAKKIAERAKSTL